MRSHLAVAALLLSLSALFGPALQSPAQDKVAISGPLTFAELGTILKNVGYDMKPGSGGSSYIVILKAGTWDVPTTVKIDPSTRLIWIITRLPDVPEDKLTNERLQAALKANNSIAHLWLAKSGPGTQEFVMGLAVNNVGLGPVEIQRNLDIFSKRIELTEKIWNPKLTPTGVVFDPKTNPDVAPASETLQATPRTK